MPRYYFDVHEGEHITTDIEGMDLPTVEIAWEEAARSLAELARDTIPKQADKGPGHAERSWDHQVKIDVRDDSGPLLAVKVTFEASRRQR